MSAIHEGFLRHRRFLWLKATLLLMAACLVPYALHDPIGGANGGTWLGYALGTLAAAIVVWLAWFGVRKRRYRSQSASVRGWLSAHVYHGLALLLIATLHTGFQFGWNVHTLAYVLMVVVIASGVYGIVAYARYPTLITAHHAQSTRDAWLSEILDLNEQALRVADTLDPEVHRVILRSTDRIRVGGGFWRQLFRPGTSVEDDIDLLRQRLQQADPPEASVGTTMRFMASQMSRAASSADRTRQLLDLLARRRALIDRVNEDVQLHARMRVWLFLHVPLTLALLAALLVHVVSVFLYW